MAEGDKYNYTLQSCDIGSYPDIENVCTQNAASPYVGLIVTETGQSPLRRYLVVLNGINTNVCQGWMPSLTVASFDTCADPRFEFLHTLQNCQDQKELRFTLLDQFYSEGVVLQFDGECSCWKVVGKTSNHDEEPTVLNSYVDCTECIEEVVNGLCDYEERTIGYAVGVGLPKPEPPNRGFKECCYSNLVLADLSNSDDFYNDYTSVFFKRQTPNDTVLYELVGQSTGTITLVDGTHGVELTFGGTAQPDLSFFRVEWRKILSLIGEDTFVIKKTVSIAGVAVPPILSNNYELKAFSTTLADNTVRIDANMNGKLVRIDTDFRNTGYKNSLRVQGFFGDRQSKWEQDNVVFSSKKSIPYFNDQITMSNNYEYTFQAYQIPECIGRYLDEEILFGNELFVSDYNINNYSYGFEVTPVSLLDDTGATYPIKNRLININLTFTDRAKDNRKTNY